MDNTLITLSKYNINGVFENKNVNKSDLKLEPESEHTIEKNVKDKSNGKRVSFKNNNDKSKGTKVSLKNNNDTGVYKLQPIIQRRY